LLYVLWDLSQVDPSDLSSLFAGQGRLRIGFSEINPPVGQEPGDDEIHAAVRGCWENPYCAFNGPAGTSLVCIQGDWSNVVDGKIKGQLAALALRDGTDSPYNPLYARGFHVPRPWGMTTLFAEYTGNHPAIDIEWSADKRVPLRLTPSSDTDTIPFEDAEEAVTALPDEDVASATTVAAADVALSPSFSTFWEFALAINRSDPAALRLAEHGDVSAIPIDGRELRKLLGTFWFRSAFTRLSPEWQAHILGVLAEHVTIPDHAIRNGRHTVHLHETTHEQRRQMMTEPRFSDAIRADLQLLVTIATLWGEEALARFDFAPLPEVSDTSRIALLLHPFRHS
jgi:hypothetical protein